MGSRCDVCGLRKRAEGQSNSLISRLRPWHTTWRSIRKVYQSNGPKQDPNRQQLHKQV
jgi:hypothetical protein